MRSFPRSPRTGGQRFASAVLAAFAAVAVAACEPVPQTTKQSDRGAAERPDPSYGGPARQIRGLERLYRVESGDTMAEIARLYGMDPVAIEEVNGLQQPYQLFVGGIPHPSGHGVLGPG